jgi:F420H(2)-dependent quinone reductase
MTAVKHRRGRGVAAFLHASGRLPGTRLLTRLHARVYRRSRGRIIRRWFGAPVLVLEVAGRRTGKLRTVSLIYLDVGDDGYLVTAANAGSAAVPQWWPNLREAGEAVVQVGAIRYPVRPRLLQGIERERRWEELTDAVPSIEHYTQYTQRSFPLVLLEPTGTDK